MITKQQFELALKIAYHLKRDLIFKGNAIVKIEISHFNLGIQNIIEMSMTPEPISQETLDLCFICISTSGLPKPSQFGSKLVLQTTFGVTLQELEEIDKQIPDEDITPEQWEAMEKMITHQWQQGKVCLYEGEFVGINRDLEQVETLPSNAKLYGTLDQMVFDTWREGDAFDFDQWTKQEIEQLINTILTPSAYVPVIFAVIEEKDGQYTAIMIEMPKEWNGKILINTKENRGYEFKKFQ